MIHLFLIKIFGFYTGFRLLKHFATKSIVTSTQMTKIGIAYIFINGLVCMITQEEILHWLALFVPLFLFIVFVFIKYISMEKQFCSQFPEFLTKIILKMKTGWSFRKSFEYSCKEAPEIYKERLNGIFENVVFSQQENIGKTGPFGLFISQILTEFRLIQRNQHQAIDRLCNFRDCLINERFFRRKSRQIWLHFGAQLGILSIIYWFLWFFICFQYGFYEYKNVFLLSLSFYLVGFLVLFIFFKGNKWRI